MEDHHVEQSLVCLHLIFDVDRINLFRPIPFAIRLHDLASSHALENQFFQDGVFLSISFILSPLLIIKNHLKK